MPTPLERQLLFVTGKGGVGKTTVAAALARLAASRGRRTIVVEVGDQGRMPELFGLPAGTPGVAQRLQERLWGITIDPDRALIEWLQALGGRVSGRVLGQSGTFQYFAAAAPGTKELVTLVKIWNLLGGGKGRRTRPGAYELIVLDAPATGHALGMLGSPRTFQAIARAGPVASQTRQVRELLEDPSRSAYLGVAHATDMAITEALELEQGLRARVGQGLAALIVNALMPRRFTSEELARLESLEASDGAVASAVAAARAAHERARLQHNQLARLRRRELEVIGLPFLWDARLELAAVDALSAQLARRL